MTFPCMLIDKARRPGCLASFDRSLGDTSRITLQSLLSAWNWREVGCLEVEARLRLIESELHSLEDRDARGVL